MMSTTRKHAKVKPSLRPGFLSPVLGGCLHLAWAGLFVFGLAGHAGAFDPASLPPAARMTADISEDYGSVRLPLDVAGGDDPNQQVDGALRKRAWLIPSPTLPTLRIVQGLRGDLASEGYEIVLDCASEVCGGFDFRFGLPVLPAPAMNVDLFDFRVITARKASGKQLEYLYFLVSKGRTNRFVQLYEVQSYSPEKGGSGTNTGLAAGTGLGEPLALSGTNSPNIADPAAMTDIAKRLITQGHVVLADLDFASGAGGLRDRKYASLAALASFLNGNSARQVLLVGHTDAVGSLQANTALSQERASAVRDRLVTGYGVNRSQISASGAGYLAPHNTNLTPQGRESNRRVEAVLLAAE